MTEKEKAFRISSSFPFLESNFVFHSYLKCFHANRPTLCIDWESFMNRDSILCPDGNHRIPINLCHSIYLSCIPPTLMPSRSTVPTCMHHCRKNCVSSSSSSLFEADADADADETRTLPFLPFLRSDDGVCVVVS